MKSIKSNWKRSMAAALGGLIFIGLLSAGVFTSENWTRIMSPVQAQEATPRSPGVQQQFHCSNATLDGRYAYVGHGFVPGARRPRRSFPLECRAS